MKRFFLFLAALIFGFALVNLLYLWILPKVDWNFKKAKEASDFTGRSFDVLVFGNSTALDGINTEMLSNSMGSAYNFAIGGASLETNYIQLQNYLRKNRVPSHVFLFLSSCHINYETNHELNPIVQYYYDDSIEVPTLSALPLFRFRWLFMENLKLLLSKDHRSATVVDGQLRLAKTVPDVSNPVSSADSDCLDADDYSMPGYHFLEMISRLCLKHNISITIFEMPCWIGRQNYCNDAIVNLGKKIWIHNLNNVDICSAVLNPRTDWLSENHLNFSGSIKLTNYILKLGSDTLHVRKVLARE